MTLRIACCLVALALPALALPAHADRIRAEVDCEAALEDLLYGCHFSITLGGEPLRDAEFTVTPTMPSMPMAHNIPPVRSETGCDGGGNYHVWIKLDMHGEWALTLDFTEPRRDRVVLRNAFLPGDGSAPAGHSHSH